MAELTNNDRFKATMAGLTTSPNPSPPDRVDELTSGDFVTEENIGDSYGAMLEGFVKAPETGEYHFFITSDDSSAAWVMTVPDTMPPSEGNHSECP